MKRILGLFTTIILIAAMFSSCGTQTGVNNSETSAGELDKIRIAGVTYEPYFYRNIDGNYDGIDVELAREACRRLGYEPVFSTIGLGSLFSTLESGEADCVWSCTSMDKYGDMFKWAGPYLYSQRVVIVKSESDIHTLKELDGKRIAVQLGSASEGIILEKDGTEGFPNLEQISVFESLGEAFTALKNGYADAAAGQEAALGVYADEYPGDYRYLDMSIQSERLGAAFSKNAADDMVNRFNDVLNEMTEDGTTAAVIEKYGLDTDRNVYGGSENETKGSEH